MLHGVLVWIAIQPAVGAVPSPIELEWDAPAECPDADAVRAEIEQLAIGERRAVEAIAVVTRVSEGAWHLDLELSTVDGRQHHEWDALACGSLARGAALAIGAAADTTALTMPPPIEAPRTTDSPPAVVEPPPDVVPRETITRGAASRPTPARASTLHGWARLHVAAGVAQLPGFDARFGVAGGVGWRWLRAEAIAAVSLPRQTRAADVDVGASMLAIDGAVRVGGSTSGRIAVGGLAGVEIGIVRAGGLDVATPDTATDLWIAATLGPVLTIAIRRRLAFFAGVDGVVALRRPRFAIREQADVPDGEIVFRPRRGGARVWLGFGVRFGRRS